MKFSVTSRSLCSRAKSDSGMWTLRFGASVREGGIEFRVWAPRLERVALSLHAPRRIIPMSRESEGEFATFVSGIRAGAD